MWASMDALHQACLPSAADAMQSSCLCPALGGCRLCLHAVQAFNLYLGKSYNVMCPVLSVLLVTEHQ